jgi:anti-sigma-K factor RskA
MNCDERKDLLLLYAADALEAEPREEMADHLATGCPRCAGAIAEAEAVLGHLAAVLEPVEPPAAVRDRLMARIAAGRERGAVRPVDRRPVTPDRRPRLEGWLRPALAAGVGALVSYLAVSVPAAQARRALEAQLAAQRADLRELRRSMQGAEARIRILTAPAVQVVSLSGTGAQPDARGRIFWDRARERWHLYVSGMGSPGGGKTYQLWFITADQQKISAGTFDVDASGEATLDAVVPPGLAVALAAITDEPAGGSPQPTGSIQMVGSIGPAT